jgi:phosphatidylserine decarboxylase
MLKDLKGQPVGEPKPLLQSLGIKAQLITPPVFLKAFTKYTCKKKGQTTDKRVLKEFAETYKIKWREAERCKGAKTLDQCVGKFKTLNDLFTRKLRPSLTRVAAAHKRRPLRIVSAAESRAQIVSPHKQSFSIKNANYTLPELLGAKASSWVKQAKTVVVFRLAPADYHHVHAPVSATVKAVEDIDGTYYSVDPFMLKRKAVLQKNARKVLSLQLANGVRGALVIIGATCVGSIDVHVKPGDRLQKGQDLGAFLFGGSCTVLVLDHASTFHPRFAERSEEGEETYLRVGEYIGDILRST